MTLRAVLLDLVAAAAFFAAIAGVVIAVVP